MAFATYYDGSFSDILGQTVTIDIQKDGASDSGDLTFGGQPLVWNAIDDTPDRIYGIKRTTVDIGLVGMDALFATIRDADIKTYKVVITGPIDGTYWADTRRLRAFIGPRSNNVLRCSDGIDLLKTVAWYADEDAAIAAGRVSFISAFATILANTGLGLGLRTGCRYYANNTGISTDDDPLAEYDFDAGWLYQKLHKAAGGSDNRPRFVSAFDALWHLLKRWNLKLVQYENRWLIHHMRYSGNTWWNYTSAGAADDPTTSTVNLVCTHSATYYQKMGDGYYMASGPAYERVESVFDFDLVSQLIRDPMFVSLNNATDYRWKASTGTTTELPIGAGYLPGTPEGTMRIYETSYASNTTITLAQARADAINDLHYVQSDWSETAVEAQNNNIIEFSAGARYIVNATFDNGIANHWVFYSIEATSENIAGQTAPDGANHFFLQDDGSWTTSANLLATELTESPYSQSLVVGIGKRATLDSDLVAGTGYKFRIKLWAAHDTYYKDHSDAEAVTAIEWMRPNLYSFEDDADVSTEKRFVTTNATGIGTDVMDDDVFYIGDGPQPSNRSAIVHTDSGDATSIWGVNKGWLYATVGSSAKTFDQNWAEQCLVSFGFAPRQYDAELVQIKTGADYQNTFFPASFARQEYIRGDEATGTVYVTSYRHDAKSLRTRILGYVNESTETGSTTEISDNNFVYRVYVAQPVNIDAPFIQCGAITVTTTTADWWFENGNSACRSVTYLVSTSGTWSITAGTTKAVAKGQAQADQETGLTADTLYYVHFKAFSNSDGTGTEGAPFTRSFRTAAPADIPDSIIILPPDVSARTLMLYDFVGTLAETVSADGGIIPERINGGAYDADFFATGADAEYTARGLYVPDGPQSMYIGKSANDGPQVILDIFETDPVTIITSSDDAGNFADFFVQPFSAGSGGTGDYYEISIGNYDNQGDDLDASVVIDNGVDDYLYFYDVAPNTEAYVLAATISRSAQTYTFRIVTSNGYYKESGSLSSSATPTAWTAGKTSITMFAAAGDPAANAMWFQVVDGALSEPQWFSLYDAIRKSLVGRDSTLATELIDISKVTSGAYSASITVGTEAANVINVAIQIEDAYGNAVSESATVTVFLSDASPPTALTSDTPSGGWAIGTDGFFVYEPTTDKVAIVTSEADGDIDINITETGYGQWYLNVQLANGKLVTSTAITFSAT